MFACLHIRIIAGERVVRIKERASSAGLWTGYGTSVSLDRIVSRRKKNSFNGSHTKHR